MKIIKSQPKDVIDTFAANNHQNKKCVKATNIDTNEVSYYNSMYAVNQHLSVNAGIVKMVCEKSMTAKDFEDR